MDGVKWQIFGIQQGFGNFFIAVVSAALADVFHIAALENPLYYEIYFGIVIDLLKVHIPKNTFIEYRFLFCLHTTKIMNLA